MFGTFFTNGARLIGAFALQTIPPALLAAYVAGQLASATGMTFSEAAVTVTACLVGCMLVSNELRD